MSKIEDGGPAFPRAHFDMPPQMSGISMRDYFAARAMCVFLADLHLYGDTFAAARMAYAAADAMLSARSKS